MTRVASLSACLLLATCTIPLKGTTFAPDLAVAADYTVSVGPVGALPTFVLYTTLGVVVGWFGARRRNRRG